MEKILCGWQYYVTVDDNKWLSISESLDSTTQLIHSKIQIHSGTKQNALMNDFFNYWIIQSTGLTKQVIVFISESFESFTQITCSKTLIDLSWTIYIRRTKTNKITGHYVSKMQVLRLVWQLLFIDKHHDTKCCLIRRPWEEKGIL